MLHSQNVVMAIFARLYCPGMLVSFLLQTFLKLVDRAHGHFGQISDRFIVPSVEPWKSVSTDGQDSTVR